MKTKQIITQYSDSELSLLFNNDESLYNEYMKAVRRNDWNMLKDLALELFECNSAQLDELENTFSEKVAEYNKD